MNIKKLQKNFEKKGVNYRRLYRKDGFMIYICTDIEFGYSYFEVFEKRMAKPHPLSGKDYDYVELYPTDNSFGLWAYTCKTADELVQIVRNHYDKGWNTSKILKNYV